MSLRFGHASRDEPEINLIPFIDVLLVVLIFLMLSTTYAKFTEMQLRLPTADTETQRSYPKEVIVTVSSEGAYLINRQTVDNPQLASLAQALQTAAQDSKDTVVIINADASARHQSVITVMEAARRVGLTQITFATQSSAQGGKR